MNNDELQNNEVGTYSSKPVRDMSIEEFSTYYTARVKAVAEALAITDQPEKTQAEKDLLAKVFVGKQTMVPGVKPIISKVTMDGMKPVTLEHALDATKKTVYTQSLASTVRSLDSFNRLGVAFVDAPTGAIRVARTVYLNKGTRDKLKSTLPCKDNKAGEYLASITEAVKGRQVLCAVRLPVASSFYDASSDQLYGCNILVALA